MERGHDDWLAGVRERMSAQRAELHDRPPFPVWGLSSPPLQPYVVESCVRDSRGWQAVTVRYGPAPPAGPSVAVTSTMRKDDPDLAALLAARWPAQPPASDHLDTAIVAHGEAHPTRVVLTDRTWAARIRLPLGVRVTVLASDVPVGSVWLATVDDLAPYWPAAERVLPWASGLDPHRALVEDLLARRRPNPVRRLRCVRAQRRIAHTDRRTAAAAVDSMLAQVAALRDRAGWFVDPQLRRAAVEDILRYTGYGDDVASRPAQQAWERHGADAEWERAWSRWAVRDAPGQ